MVRAHAVGTYMRDTFFLHFHSPDFSLARIKPQLRPAPRKSDFILLRALTIQSSHRLYSRYGYYHSRNESTTDRLQTYLLIHTSRLTLISLLPTEPHHASTQSTYQASPTPTTNPLLPSPNPRRYHGHPPGHFDTEEGCCEEACCR